MRGLGLILAAALAFGAGGVARAQQPNANPPAPAPGTPPEPGVLEPPPETTPPPNPTVPPTVPPAPVTARPTQHKPRWIGPVTIALEVGAVGFAVASVAVISSGPTTDAWRVNTAAGLGAGTIACAGVGVVLGLVFR